MLKFSVQGEHVLIGTDRDMRLWGLQDRKNPKLLATVGHYTCSISEGPSLLDRQTS